MAKGKHSTALFEVIHSANRPERVAQSLRTPKWWFNGRPTSGANPGEAPDVAAVEETTPAAEPEAAPRRAYATKSGQGGRSSAVHFEFDRERQEITVRLRYTTAVVSAFSVCVLLALAYVAGRHISHGPQAASASEEHIQQLQQEPPQRGVTEITRSHRQQQGSIVTEPPKRVVDTPPVQQPRSREPASAAPPGVETRLPRSVNLNYVIIQSYPRDRRDTAEKAREFFTRNGLPCTLIWIDPNHPDWICLVGTWGFQRISAPEYKEYLEKIGATWAKGNGAKFDQFQSYGYKWKGTEAPVD